MTASGQREHRGQVTSHALPDCLGRTDSAQKSKGHKVYDISVSPELCTIRVINDVVIKKSRRENGKISV